MPLLSWGQNVVIEAGGAGSITLDCSTREYIVASDAWTADRLPFSMGALHKLALPVVDGKTRLGRFKHDITGQPAATLQLGQQIEHQVQYYRETYKNAHIPVELLKQTLLDDSLQSILPRHNRLVLLKMNASSEHEDVIVAYPSGLSGDCLSIQQLGQYYDQDMDVRTYPRLQALDQEVCKFFLPTPILKISKSRRTAHLLVATHGTVEVFDYSNRHSFNRIATVDCESTTIVDASITDHGQKILVGEIDGTCRLMDTSRGKESVRWSLPQSLQFLAPSHEFAYFGAATNQIILLDPRTRQTSHAAFPIGGTPTGFLPMGDAIGELAFLAGPDRLVAIDVRQMRQPILQWDSQDCFGGGLSCMSAGSIPDASLNPGNADCLFGVAGDTLHMLPLQRRPVINTVTAIEPRLLPSLNANRLYGCTDGGDPIAGFDTLTEPDHAGNARALAVHMTDRGTAAFQYFSFSDAFSHEPSEDAGEGLDWQEVQSSGLGRFRFPPHSHADLFKRALCTGEPRRKYHEITPAERDAMQTWRMPLKADRYIPKMLHKTIERMRDVPEGKVDEGLLSSAGVQLNKRW